MSVTAFWVCLQLRSLATRLIYETVGDGLINSRNAGIKDMTLVLKYVFLSEA
jgi:hypothetical protein